MTGYRPQNGQSYRSDKAALFILAQTKWLEPSIRSPVWRFRKALVSATHLRLRG